jgi:peptide/nickel transport system permease protein
MAFAWSTFRLSVQPRLREWRYGFHRLRQSKLALLGLALVVLYAAVALLAPFIAPTPENQADPYKMRVDFRNDLKPPGTGGKLFGTGQSGIDLFYGVVWGSRISIVMGLSVTLAGAIIGTILGGMAGYFGGRVDEAIMRLTDVFLAMPILILAMAVTTALGPGLFNIGLALVIVWWPSYTRLVRGTVLSIRESQYVEAARAVGASDWRIITRHVLPNSLSPILVQATLDIGSVVLLSAALSFIGFGPGGSNFAEWGTMVSQGQQYMQRAWWPVTVPGLAIFGFVFAFNLLGDGLRDLLDPRLRT